LTFDRWLEEWLVASRYAERVDGALVPTPEGVALGALLA
jgi:hypothetical protein